MEDDRPVVIAGAQRGIGAALVTAITFGGPAAPPIHRFRREVEPTPQVAPSRKTSKAKAQRKARKTMRRHK